MTVDVVHWNPRRRVLPGPLGRLVPLRRPVDNFGDLLGPLIVRRVLEQRSLSLAEGVDARLLAVGSILRMARDGDVLWGIGANGKSLDDPYGFERLDVRAVRGPRTAAHLRNLGHRVPEVFGDPGLLVGRLWTRSELMAGARPRAVAVVPNLHDHASLRGRPDVVDPRAPLREVLRQIAASELVVGSSLHGIVVAESLGIPARLVTPGTEPAFKYEDYYLGSGRAVHAPAEDVASAIRMGGEPAPDWDPAPLLDAFPWDLWRR